MKVFFHELFRVGDSTAYYNVTTSTLCTVRDFLEWVIRDCCNEWGSIGVASSDKLRAQYCKTKLRYNKGKMSSELPDDILDKTIISIKADGGRKYMNYILKVEGGEQ